MDLDQLGSATAPYTADDGCGMMSRRAATTGVPRVTNALALLRLLPMSDRDKDTEILVLRHEIAVPQRQLGAQKPRFDPTDRALLAALHHRLPKDVLRRLRLFVRPDTILRRHHDLVASSHVAVSGPKRPGRSRTLRSIRVLVLIWRENPVGVIDVYTVNCSCWV